MILGGVLTGVVLALGLIPRETRMLERIEHDARDSSRWSRPRSSSSAALAGSTSRRTTRSSSSCTPGSPSSERSSCRRRRTAASPSTSLRRFRPRRSSSVPGLLDVLVVGIDRRRKLLHPLSLGRLGLQDRDLPVGHRPERQHPADLAHHRVRQRMVRLVHDDHVGNLHHARLQRLDGVAGSRHQHEHDGVGVVDDVDLGLADADRLDQHVVLAGGVHQQHGLQRRLRQARRAPRGSPSSGCRRPRRGSARPAGSGRPAGRPP